FALHTVDGSIYYGYPKKITEKQVIFTANNAGNIRLRPSEVQYIEPVISTLVAREAYVNEYAISTKKWFSENGKFLGYQHGKILHNDAVGNISETDISELQSYKLLSQPLSFKGHGRSLMFAQTGFGMKPREKEYRNIMVGINVLSYGFSENFSMSAGLISFLPYLDVKLSKSLGKYVHISGGGYGFLPFSVGFHGALSLGTPNYFINIGYNKNIDNEATYISVDFEDFNCGASIKTGRRSRVFAEYHILTSKSDDDRYGMTFYQTGFANSFSWGYGWFNRRLRFEAGIMQTGPYLSWNCFSTFSNSTCREYFHVPIPFFSMAISFLR
nr:hypothetical protein [Saprospiraceae bacterium]